MRLEVFVYNVEYGGDETTDAVIEAIDADIVGALEPPGSHVQVERVQHDLVDRFHDLHRHRLEAGERRRLQIGFEDQVVAMGDDGAGQAVASLVVVHALSDRRLVGHALSRSRR